jgi:multiple sugar transport system substrate-binding protein
MRTHPDIDVQILNIPANYYQKLLVMIAGRNAPDLMWMGQSLAEFVERDALLDVTGRVETDVDLSRFRAEPVEWYRRNGRLYGVPFGLDMKFMAYNAELFDEAGLPYPSNDWTFEEFLRAAQGLTRRAGTDADGRVERYGFRGAIGTSLFGAEVIAADGKRPLCESPEMLRYLRVNLDLAEKYNVSPRGRQTMHEAVEDDIALFRQGRVAMIPMSTWRLPFMREQCAEMNWNVVTNPSVDGRRSHFGSSHAIVISSATRHPHEAWLVTKFLLSPRFQRSMATIAFPTDREVARQVVAENQQKPANLAALLKASESLHPNPRVAHLTEIMALWQDACESVWIGRATPEQAMARAARQIDRAIQTHHLQQAR